MSYFNLGRDILLFTLIIVIWTKVSDAGPLFNDKLHDDELKLVLETVRMPRSPQKGEFTFEADKNKGDRGKDNTYIRGEYQQRWGEPDKAHVDAHAHYEKNWGSNKGEKHGGGVKITVPFGDK